MLQGDIFSVLTVCGTLQRIVDIYFCELLAFIKISLALFIIPLALSSLVKAIAFAEIQSFIVGFLANSSKDNAIYSDDDIYSGVDDEVREAMNSATDAIYNGVDDEVREAINSATLDDGLGLAVNAIEWVVALVVFNIVVWLIMLPLAKGSFIRAVADVYIGREPDWIQCIKSASKRYCPLLAATFLYSLIPSALIILVTGVTMGLDAITGGKDIFLITYLTWIVAAVVFFLTLTRLMTYGPAIIVDNCGVCESFKKSWKLSRGNECYIFCVCSIFFLCVEVIVIILVSVLRPLLGDGIVFGIFWVAVRTLTMPLTGILVAVIYFNLRVKCESFTIECLMNEVDVEPSSSAAGFQAVSSMDTKDATHALVDAVDSKTCVQSMV